MKIISFTHEGRSRWGLLQPDGIAPMDHHVGAVLRQFGGDGTSDAAGAAGNNGHLAYKRVAIGRLGLHWLNLCSDI